MTLSNFGTICITLALLLDSISYWKQIAKTLRTRKSKDVSSSAYLYKIAKAIIAAIGLCIFANYVGLAMELVMLTVYIVSLAVIAKYKPKGWRLF